MSGYIETDMVTPIRGNTRGDVGVRTRWKME